MTPEWIWTDDQGFMHIDAPLYARLRGIGMDQAMEELHKMLAEHAPETRVIEL